MLGLLSRRPDDGYGDFARCLFCVISYRSNLLYKGLHSAEKKIKNRILTRAELENEIDNWRPVYSAWYLDNFKDGHSVCMTGYGNYWGTPTVDIMESLYGCFRVINQANNEYRMSYLNGNYKWCNAITISE